MKNKRNYTTVAEPISDALREEINTSASQNGVYTNTEETTTDKSRPWRRLTLTLTILATSLTLTFSWQKKNKTEATKQKIEQVNASNDGVITSNDTLNLAK